MHIKLYTAALIECMCKVSDSELQMRYARYNQGQYVCFKSSAAPIFTQTVHS